MKRKGFAAETVQRSKDSMQLAANQEPAQVVVTILLAGGQQYKVTVSPDDELLQDLYETMMTADANSARRLFQISINSGQAVLAFPSNQLVGIVTEPPLVIEQQPAHPELAQFATGRDPLVSEYAQLDNFLTVAEHQQLLAHVMQRQAEFVPTTTFTGEQNYRESVVLYSFPEYADLIAQRIHTVLPEVCNVLNLPPFPISQVEAQLTAHNDKQFYRVHNDNGSPDTATRELTYVYYFYREPKPFTGGELVIYDSKIENNYYTQANTYKVVEPRNNSIVFFFSRYMHEVLPIHCPSQKFIDSRFTINGWLRR